MGERATDGLDWVRGREVASVSRTGRDGRPLATVLVAETGLVRNDPIPEEAELEAFYATEYRRRYKRAERPRRRQILRNFRRAAAQIERFADVHGRARRVFDAGAGSGEFLFLMSTCGTKTRGVEPNEAYAAYCREALGLDVATGVIAPELCAPGSQDLVRLNHVLEHLRDPVGALATLREWLADDGLLHVEVPNIEVYCRTKSTGGMFHYGHIYNFNPWTLRAAAGLAGLEEAAETAARSAGTTGAFFRKGAVIAPEEAENPANAATVAEMIRQHYARDVPAGRRRRVLTRLLARIEETLTGLRHGSPKRIGEAVARRMHWPEGVRA